MSCYIVRDPSNSEIENVFAPNDKPSQLYKKILLNVRRVKPNSYIQSALEKGLIRNSNKKEIALALWSKIYTPEFKEWYGNWLSPDFTGLLDKNGEPDIVVEPDGTFLNLSNNQYLTLEANPDDLVYSYPEKPTTHQEYTTPNTPVVKQKFEQLLFELKQDDSSALFDAIEQEDGRITVNKVVRVNDSREDDILKISEITDRLQAIFPSLRIQLIDEDQLSTFDFNGRNVDHNKISSFVSDGTVYLVSNRITADSIIEEWLHPFVSTLQRVNEELFQNLLTESQNKFPDIHNQVKFNYSLAKGFTENDQKIETVTKALQYGLSQKLISNPTEKDYALGTLLKQFLQYLTTIFRKITGKSKLYVGSIPSNTTINELLTLLDNGLQIELGPMDKRVFFNLVDERLDIYNRILAEANEVQKDVVKNLTLNNAIFFEDTHKYIHAETGEEYNSVTKLIKGKIDEDDLYALNRAIGKEFDFIMNSVVLGSTFDEIRPQLKIIKPEIIRQFYEYFKIYLSGIKANGSIVVPQIVLADDTSMSAGTLDLLIIDPFGNKDIIDLKVSKNSILGKSYDKKWEVTNDPSLFIGEELSTRQQHGIQQHCYKKLVELVPPINNTSMAVRSVKTFHIRIGIAKNTVIGFEPEGYVDHTTSNYSEFVDKIIPTPLPKTKGFQTLLQAQALPENAPIVERIQDVVEQFSKKIKQRKLYYENINASTTGKTTASTAYLTELADLVNQIDEEMGKGSPAGAFYQIIKFINNDLRRKTQQVNGTQVAKDKLVGFLLETEKDINDYIELLSIPKLTLNNPTLIRLSKESLEFADSLRSVVDIELKEFIKSFVKTNSSRSFTEEQLEDLLKETKDISQTDYLFGDLATSPDTLLATLDKTYKAKLQEIYDFTDRTATELVQLGKKLGEVSGAKPDYGFMIHKDDQGKPTGYYVRKIGSQYWSALGALKEKIQDENGRMLKYREVFNLSTASQEDIDYNLNLIDGKNAYREFMQPETLDVFGEMVDGQNHRYIKEFKQVRSQFEYLHTETVDGEIVYHEWRKKPGVTEAEYKKYLAKYYTEEITYLSPVKENLGSGVYAHLGRVVERSNRFVKREFIEVREYTSNGKSLLDPRYEKIQNPTTELENVQKEFYNTWIELYEKQLEKLPADQRRKMAGRLPIVWDRHISEIKTKSPGIIKGILKGLRDINPFDLNIYSHNMLTNEDGEIENQIPVFYVGDFQNQKSIEKLEAKIKELGVQLQKKEISLDEYKQKLKSTTQALSIEKGKITKDKLSVDMVKNLSAFAHMAERYRVMSAFENTVKAIYRLASTRTYTKEGPAGTINSSSTKEPAKFSATESLMLKRLDKWKEMIFYQSSNPYHSKWGQVSRKMMRYLSLKSVALNPFGQLNNYVVGNVNNIIQAIGGDHFSFKDYLRAVYKYNREYLPGVFSRFAHKLTAENDYYIVKEPNSKFEAFVSMFRIMRKLQSADVAGEHQNRFLDKSYFLQELVEYNIQTKTGMAILMSKKLKNSITHELCSIYDAFDFDEKAKKLIIKKGFELPPEQIHGITNFIYEVNKQLHGNHAPEDKMVIQQHLVGEFAAQYHKHIAPFIRSRYGGEYEDENLGKMQGRYMSVYHFMKYALDLKSTAESWNQLSDHQKRNVIKSSADLAFMLLSFALYHMFKSIGDGIDDDDETTKKFANLLTSQSDRLYDEIAQGVVIWGTVQQYQVLKSPLAILGFAKDCLEVTAEAIKAPIPPYDDLYFKNGVNKGDLKVVKELMDVVPVLNLFNRWDSYETVKQFYIK